MGISRAMLLLFSLCMMVLLASCSTISRETDLMKKADAVNISRYELRARLNNVAVRFSAIVEEAADEIIAKAEDPEIQHNALIWKLNAIPASQKALFMSDPLAALIDISTFSIQMQVYFSEGSGKNLFGEWQHIAVNATTQLEEEIIKIWRKVRGTIDLTKKEETLIYQWARKHPIESLTFIRHSVSDTLYTLFDDKQFGFRETVGSIAVSAHDIQEQLTIYTYQLPKQARWQAEYLMNKTLDNEEIERSLDNFSQITESIERITGVMEESPALVNDLQASTITELRKERIAILETIREERIAVLNEIDRQRLATIEDIEALTIKVSGKVMEETSNTLNGLIDHLFWRMVQLLLIAGILGITGFFLIRKVL